MPIDPKKTLERLKGADTDRGRVTLAMTIDAKKMLQDLRVKGETAKGSVTLYLDKALWRDFQKACKEVSPSTVIAAFMREFVESSEPKKK